YVSVLCGASAPHGGGADCLGLTRHRQRTLTRPWWRIEPRIKGAVFALQFTLKRSAHAGPPFDRCDRYADTNRRVVWTPPSALVPALVPLDEFIEQALAIGHRHLIGRLWCRGP